MKWNYRINLFLLRKINVFDLNVEETIKYKITAIDNGWNSSLLTGGFFFDRLYFFVDVFCQSTSELHQFEENMQGAKTGSYMFRR